MVAKGASSVAAAGGRAAGSGKQQQHRSSRRERSRIRESSSCVWNAAAAAGARGAASGTQKEGHIFPKTAGQPTAQRSAGDKVLPTPVLCICVYVCCGGCVYHTLPHRLFTLPHLLLCVCAYTLRNVAEDVCMLYVAEDVYAVCCGGSVPSIWVYDAEDMGRMRGCIPYTRSLTHTHTHQQAEANKEGSANKRFSQANKVFPTPVLCICVYVAEDV